MILQSQDNLQIASNKTVGINGADGVHIGDANTGDVVILPAGVLFLKFHAADPANWEGDAPVYVWDALNRLAAALAASGHKP